MSSVDVNVRVFLWQRYMAGLFNHIIVMTPKLPNIGMVVGRAVYASPSSKNRFYIKLQSYILPLAYLWNFWVQRNDSVHIKIAKKINKIKFRGNQPNSKLSSKFCQAAFMHFHIYNSILSLINAKYKIKHC